IGAYVGWWVLALLLRAQVGGLHPAWVLPLMLLHAMLFTGALGVGLERFAYRPLYLRGATRLGPLISAIGASIFLQNAVMLTQGARMKVYMTSLLFPRSWRIQIAGASISALVIVMVVVAGLMMWGLHLLVQRTTLGRSIRAVAEDREMAAIMGVNVRRVIAVTFFMGSRQVKRDLIPSPRGTTPTPVDRARVVTKPASVSIPARWSAGSIVSTKFVGVAPAGGSTM